MKFNMEKTHSLWLAVNVYVITLDRKFTYENMLFIQNTFEN